MHCGRILSAGMVFGGLCACSADLDRSEEQLAVTQWALREAPIAENFGDPLPHLTPALSRRFQTGLTQFSSILQSEDGVGYAFSGVPGCFICHIQPAIGGSSGVTQVRFGLLADDGSFDPLLAKGGPSLQFVAQVGPGTQGCPATSPIPLETTPAEANVVVSRHSPALFGLGLVEAIPDDALEHLARLQRTNRDGVRGRVNHVTDATTGRTRAGRFGLKAQIVTLPEFVATALLNELGITSPLLPNEICESGDCTFADCDGVPNPDMNTARVSQFVDFVRLLSPPPPRTRTPAACDGERVFHQIGCATCHAPTQITGPSPIKQLDRVAFHPYSDFLIHDLGPPNQDSADMTTQGEARAQFVRTTPLWGTNSAAELFHDGRGGTVPGAVFWHGGEAQVARDRFMALSPDAQAAVTEFVLSL